MLFSEYVCSSHITASQKLEQLYQRYHNPGLFTSVRHLRRKAFTTCLANLLHEESHVTHENLKMLGKGAVCAC